MLKWLYTIMLYGCFRFRVLMLQSAPINPCVQLQLYSFTPSTHTPSFLQGLELQSSISEGQVSVDIRIVWFFIISLKHFHQFLRIELTNLAVCSRKSNRTITFIGCNSIMTNSSIVTRLFFTIVDISKYRNALEFIVIFAISFMICHTDIIYLETNLLPCYSI